MKTANIITLGCRLNIAESDALAYQLKNLGFEIVPRNQYADITIINTCTVTDKADSKNRNVIRKVVRDMNNIVVVTGCYAETDKKTIESIPGVSIVINNRDKASLPRIIADSFKKNENKFNHVPNETNFSLSPPEGHTRAYLKIQDGCNNRCSFCKIPHARGNAVSASLSLVKDNFINLNKRNIPEVVITGIDIGCYEHGEGDDSIFFEDLLKILLDMRLKARIRISSIEPVDINESLLMMVSSKPNFCPFFHVPAQSGSDKILSSMNRGYTKEKYRSKIELIRRIFSETALNQQSDNRGAEKDYHQFSSASHSPFIGTDFIIGFPGQNDEDFEEDLELACDLEFSKIHVFPFSIRRDTDAALMDKALLVSKEVIRKRVNKLLSLSKELQKKYAQKFFGKNLFGVLQQGEPPYFLTENFLKIILDDVNTYNKLQITDSLFNLSLLDFHPDKEDFLLGKLIKD
jgi:threonylcarbamoyladenosine tRNA methylthiotransferase MtaB